MATKSLTANSIEELATIALENATRLQGEKFVLRSNTTWEYDDPEAGAAWDKLDDEITHWYYSLPWEEQRSHDQERNEKLAAIGKRPSTHQEISYYLDKQGRYSGMTIWISEEMGKQIDAVWTKRPAYRNANYTKNVGGLSLEGILKRLGKTDITEQVKAAIAEATAKKVAQEKRWWAQSRVKELKELEKSYQELAARFEKAGVPLVADLSISLEAQKMLLEQYAPGYDQE